MFGLSIVLLMRGVIAIDYPWTGYTPNVPYHYGDARVNATYDGLNDKWFCNTTSQHPDLCHRECTNYRWDEENCGECGNKIEFRHLCCNGQDIDPMTHEDHCGECFHACPSTLRCGNGECEQSFKLQARDPHGCKWKENWVSPLKLPYEFIVDKGVNREHSPDFSLRPDGWSKETFLALLVGRSAPQHGQTEDPLFAYPHPKDGSRIHFATLTELRQRVIKPLNCTILNHNNELICRQMGWLDSFYTCCDTWRWGDNHKIDINDACSESRKFRMFASWNGPS